MVKIINIALVTVSLTGITLSAKSIKDENTLYYIDAGQSIHRVLTSKDREILMKDTAPIDTKHVYYIKYHLAKKK